MRLEGLVPNLPEHRLCWDMLLTYLSSADSGACSQPTWAQVMLWLPSNLPDLRWCGGLFPTYLSTGDAGTWCWDWDLFPCLPEHRWYWLHSQSTPGWWLVCSSWGSAQTIILQEVKAKSWKVGVCKWNCCAFSLWQAEMEICMTKFDILCVRSELCGTLI
jgi:hypothetical protein